MDGLNLGDELTTDCNSIKALTFRGFRDHFLVLHPEFESLEQLNQLTQDWIENHYNNHLHGAIQMTPLQRFNLDHSRIEYLMQDGVTEEVFFIEENRKVSKVNVFSINNQKLECPVDLRSKTIQVRYDRNRRDRFIVYFNDRRMGEGEGRPEFARARSEFRPERRANGRPDWKPLPWMA